jgi:hypothetical protein
LYCAYGNPIENHAGHHKNHKFAGSNNDVERGADEELNSGQIENDSDDDDSVSDYEESGNAVLSSDGEIDEFPDANDGDRKQFDDGGSDDPDKSNVQIKPTPDNRLLLGLMLLVWQSEHLIFSICFRFN